MGAQVQNIHSGTETATGNGNSVDSEITIRENLIAQLEVTSASGTNPTLDLTLEESIDGSNWYTLATFTQATAATAEIKKATAAAQYLRANWTIGGTTPSFTFNVKVAAD